MGSETSGGAIYVLSLDDPFEFSSSSFSIGQRMTQVASFNCTIWTADCDSSASKAVVGKLSFSNIIFHFLFLFHYTMFLPEFTLIFSSID